MREYATPAAFRAAVEATLSERARRLKVPAYTRTSAVRIKRDVHPRARTDVREWFAALDSFGPEPFPDVRPTRAGRRRS